MILNQYLNPVFPHYRPDANRHRCDWPIRSVNRFHFSGKEACSLGQLQMKQQ